MMAERYETESTDYRRGFVEGQAGEIDAYLLYSGCTDLDEYFRGFGAGMTSQRNALTEEQK